MTTTIEASTGLNIYATITHIVYDFEVADEKFGISEEDQEELTQQTIGSTIFIDADNLEDIDEKIADAISDETGWLVSEVEYQLTY